MNIVKFLALLAISLVLVSCGLTPEYIKLNPDINTQISNIGHNNQLYVEVIDARRTKDSSIIGYRATSDPYPDSSYLELPMFKTISIGGNLTGVVEHAIDGGLTLKGFEPVDNASTSRKLVIRITELKYKNNTKLSLLQTFFYITVTCTMTVSAENGNKIFHRTYTASVPFKSWHTPSTNADTIYVNKTLSATINKILLDEKLLKFLGQ